MSDNCWPCEHYDKGQDPNSSVENYDPGMPPMCCEPNLMAITDENETIAVILENVLFALSERRACPFYVRRINTLRKKSLLNRDVYKSIDLKLGK